jgi:hypothetical protein
MQELVENTPRLAIPIPKMLRVRPVDRRGYPIPFIVVIDGEGRPQFTINNQKAVHECITRRLCGLCGRRLTRNEVWFIGGPRCFTDPNGAFVDPPSHEECARYAIRVCPYLAAPSYGRRIDDKLLGSMPAGFPTLVKDMRMPDDRPDAFGLGMAHRYTIIPELGMPLFRVKNWVVFERWRHGQRVTEAA